MSKEIILPMNEITDSVEMLHESPRRFMSSLAVIIAALLLTVGVWCCVGEIDCYVRANGVVRPINPVSSISLTATGRLAQLNISEGDYVRKGELLLSLDVTELERSLAAYEKERSSIEEEIACYEKLERCVESGENLFSEYDETESGFFYKYEAYAAQQLSLSGQLALLSDEKESLELLKASAETDINRLLGSGTVYESQYKDFQSDMSEYESKIELKETQTQTLSSLYEAGGISRAELEAAQTELENLKLEAQRYKQSFILSAEEKIAQTESRINSISVQGTADESSNRLALEKNKHDYLSGIADRISAERSSLEAINNSISQTRLSLENTSVTAPIDGVVNMTAPLNLHDLVQAGQTVATIVPDSAGSCKAVLYVSSADIHEASAGQSVRLRFSALPYQEYGELDGVIETISSDVRSNSATGASYYIAEVSFDGDSELGSMIISGMDCEARVVTKQKKIIFWLLEKMNFIDE